MTELQKLVLLLSTVAAAAGGMVMQNYLFGTYNMGSRTGTFGLIGIMSAFMLGVGMAKLFPHEVYAAFTFFGVDPAIFR